MKVVLALLREVITFAALASFVTMIVVWFAILAPNAPKNIAQMPKLHWVAK